MVRANASVKVCHRYTKDLALTCSQADAWLARAKGRKGAQRFGAVSHRERFGATPRFLSIS